MGGFQKCHLVVSGVLVVSHALKIGKESQAPNRAIRMAPPKNVVVITIWTTFTPYILAQICPPQRAIR